MIAQTYEGPAAAQRFPGAEVLRFDAHSGQLNYLRLAPEAQRPLREIQESPLFRKYWGQHDLVPFKTMHDPLGMTHTRLQAYHAGHAIEAAVAIVHVDQGRVTAINGELPGTKGFSGQAVLTEAQAKDKAVAHIGARQYMWQIPGADNVLRQQTGDPMATYSPAGELVYAPVKGDFNSGKYRLAWKFDIYATAPLSRDYVFVDAESGHVIWQYSRLHTADVTGSAVTAYSGTRTITTDQTGPNNFRLRETGRGGGIQTLNCQQGANPGAAVDFTDTDNNWNNVNAALDQYAPDCHAGLEVTYDYYNNTYGWNSYDDNGMTILAYVHYDVNFGNAFWDGSSVTFGDGDGGTFSSPLTNPDVVAHEVTHGVTQFSAGLIYSGESGAMNESFSDIFGKVVESIMRPGAWNWIIGAQCTPGGVGIRDMQNPNNFQNPDTYGGLFWNSGNDVHYNSAIGNKWFQVLVTGETGTNDLGNAYNVPGIGMTKAAAIAFRDLTVYLTPGSDYEDVRFYAVESARDLYGACSTEQIQTSNAWYAVGVGALTTPQPVVNFNAGYPNSCVAPATFQFQNNSSIGQSYLWDFGDGTTSTLVSPSHTYTAYGDYTVKLTVTGCTGLVDSLVRLQYIHVDSTLPCALTMSTLGVDTQRTCQGFLLDPGGNGNYADNTFASLLISPQNALSVTLTFTSFDLEMGYDFLNIYDGSDNTAPLLGSFTGNTLPNGGSITSTNSRVFLEFFSDGSVTAPGFEMYWECQPVTAPPVATFQGFPRTTCDGFVQFTNVTTQGVNSWFWDFGDGATSTQTTPNHQYATNGTYTVTLIVCNNLGCDTLAQTNYITVNNTGNCAVSMPTGTTGNSINCQGILLDPGGMLNYNDFEYSTYTIQPAGATSIVMDFSLFELETAFDFLYIYDGPNIGSPLIGAFTGFAPPNGGTVTTTGGAATLVFSSDGSLNYQGFDMQWHAINALNGAVADFSAPVTAAVGATVNFTDQSTGATTYAWDFGDGATSTLANPSHAYGAVGVYDVTLTVENSAGCIGIYHQNIYIGLVGSQDPTGPVLNVWPNPSNGLVEVEVQLGSPASARIEVRNALGQLVHAEACDQGGTLRRRLDLSAAANGLYFVRIETAEGSSVRKVMIDHASR